MPDLGAVLGGERFLAEIRVTANLQHPNLLPLFDSGQADGLLYYVMPFIQGESLRARLDREKQLPVDEALRIAKALASALDYAHRNGVIHRDLKPENILMQDGQPLIADFGIALAVSNAGGQRVTQTGLSLGTPQYMSPEQATGDRSIDARSDIYSLGAIVYEMLAGEAPHSGNTAQAVIAKLMTEDPRPLGQVRKTVPQNVEHAVRCAMEKLPADRFATPKEFADALEGRHTSMPVYTDGHALATSGAKRSRALLPFVAAVGLLIGGGATWKMGRSPTATAGDETTVRFALLPAKDGQVLTGQFALSPDGKTIVFSARDTASDESQLYVRSIDGLDARPIEGTENALSPVFSPDGEYLAFVNISEIRKTRLADGTTTTLTRTTSGFRQGSSTSTISWAHPDHIILAQSGRLSIVPTGGGPTSLIPIPDSLQQQSQLFPLALPDGKTVVYTRWWGAPGTARLGAVRIGENRFVDLGIVSVGAVAYFDGYLIYRVADGNVMAVAFDPEELTASGTPTAVLTELRQVGGASDGRAAAAMAANGTLVYQTGKLLYDLVLAGNGADSVLLARQANPTYPRMSPDGKRIAVTKRAAEGSDVWIYNTAGATVQRLTTEGLQNDRAEWSPDGSRVLFRSDRGGRFRLWSQPVSGGEARLEVDRPGKDIWEGIYSPDGQSIVYRTGTLSSADVWSTPAGRSTTDTPLIVTKFQEAAARISPNGQWIAYTSYQSGAAEVYVARYPSMSDPLQISAV